MDLGDDLSTRVDALMDGLVADLERLTAIPSIAFPGFWPEPVQEAHDLLVDLLNLRFHPAQDPREARDRLVTHLESLRPSGIPLTVAPGDTGPGFEPATDGPAYRAARTALREGRGSEPAFVASGGSIPLVNGLAKAVPGAEVLLFGAQDGMCDLHAPNERVLFSELRSAVIAEAAFPREYAKTYGDTATHADSAGGAA
ncbi:hypothetical protein [Streptomyces anulatus]|uniref:hypothetical protein n=1 Tax=Streptomyces anulatus TaxID=1892 RepID=UPI0038707D51